METMKNYLAIFSLMAVYVVIGQETTASISETTEISSSLEYETKPDYYDENYYYEYEDSSKGYGVR